MGQISNLPCKSSGSLHENKCYLNEFVKFWILVGLGVSEAQKTKCWHFRRFKGKNSSKGVFSIRKICRIEASNRILEILTFHWFQFLYLSMFWKWHLNSKRGTLNLIQYLSMKLNFKTKTFLTSIEKTLFFDLLSPLALPKFKIWQIHLTSIYFFCKEVLDFDGRPGLCHILNYATPTPA